MLIGTIDDARGHALQHTVGVMLRLHLHLTVAVEKGGGGSWQGDVVAATRLGLL